jgi:hypothetical protein
MRSIVILSVLGVLAFSCHRDDEKPCVDPSTIDPNMACTYELHLVCGCDGKTYSNPCAAKKAGVTSWVEGSCIQVN